MQVIVDENKNSKPRTKPVKGILIHSMGEFIGETPANEFLEEVGLSAHFLIRPDGTIVETVTPDRVAYHAGNSLWKGEKYLNGSYVGIEILVEGYHTYESFLQAVEDPSTFKDEQYKACADLCRNLCSLYPEISETRFVRHSDVSGDEVRGLGKGKVDPGNGFDFDRLRGLVFP